MRLTLPIAIAMLTVTSLNVSAATPAWLEADSAAAIASRISYDFPWTVAEFKAIAVDADPALTSAAVDTMIADRSVETLVIDGVQRVHRKALRNLYLLDPGRSSFTHRGATASAARIAYVDSVLDYEAGVNPVGNAHRVKYTFTIDVPGHEALAGDTLRMWMPLPIESARQHDIEILDASPADYVLSAGRSAHNTIYFEMPAPAPGDTAHAEYTAVFTTTGQYFSPEYILSNLKPYDTDSELYRRYTSTEAPHIVKLPALARAIAGDETNPFAISEKVYDFIVNFPWAGAREYSTIDCIPTYVLHEGHGDCGQVALLYISLMRTLGIPARWESGWMLHPGEKNFHDWAEVYFEGVGWVPVDMSFGRYTGAEREAARTFYSHGMDAHRMATNTGICDALYPAKRYVRSETVDFQAGEVETTSGNIFYPGFSSRLKLIEITPVK